MARIDIASWSIYSSSLGDIMEIRQFIDSYKDVQKLRVAVFARIVCWSRENRETLIKKLKKIKSDDAKFAVGLLEKRAYSEFAKSFVIRKIDDEKYKEVLKPMKKFVWLFKKLREIEGGIKDALQDWVVAHPLWDAWLSKVRGIGPVVAAGLIAWLASPREFTLKKVVKVDRRKKIVEYEEKGEIVVSEFPNAELMKYNKKEKTCLIRLPSVIECANTVSQLWSYLGLDPRKKKRRGKKAGYHPRLKAFVLHNLGSAIIKHNEFARELFEKFREQARKKHPDWTNKHVFMHSRRKVVKLFLASLWEVWREMNGLEVTEPYPIEYLGHKDKIRPWTWTKK